MATVEICPTLSDFSEENQCLEQLGGIAQNIYIGLKSDLSEKMTRELNTYSTPKFKTGKGLYMFECENNQEGISSESLGKRKGFKQTISFALSRVDADSAKILRALNNLHYFVIVKDGEDSQIIYDPDRNIEQGSGSIKTDTGKKADDERHATIEGVLSPVAYPNIYVTEPETGGWDSLLASAATKA